MSNAYFTPDDSRTTALKLLEVLAGPLKLKPGLAIVEVTRKTNLAYGTVKALWYKERAVVPWDLIKNLEVAVERMEAHSARARDHAQFVRKRGSNGRTAARLGMAKTRNKLRTLRDR